MPIQRARVNILPSAGMNPTATDGVKWVRNMKQWTALSPLEVRPGFGQRAQIDTTSAMSQDNNNNPSGGYTKHLGSYLYSSNFGSRQIISVFSVICSHSDTNSYDVGAKNAAGVDVDWYFNIHGFSEATVVSIFDLTTNRKYEEILSFKTTEGTTEADIRKVFGYLETNASYDVVYSKVTKSYDYRSFKSTSSYVSFAQISDKVFFSSSELGTWVYQGIDIPKNPPRSRIDGGCPDPQRFAADIYHSNNLHDGRSEGSVFQRVSGTSGINGRDVVYLTKAQTPKSVGMAVLGGRAVYTSGNVVWFSDVNQPGAIMANNFAAWSADGTATAISAFKNTLFVFTEKQIHAFSFRSQSAAGSPIPGVVNIHSIETNHEAGCVSSRSHCWTPYGVCFVSDWGVHMINNPQTIGTLSDKIYDHWFEGLKDPLSNYNLDAGKQGYGKQQTPMLYRHSGEPSICYDIEADAIILCYETHTLNFHFETKAWSIWPLGVRSNDTSAGGAFFTSFTGQSVVSDADGTYLISGLYDRNDSTSENPYNEGESYTISELGLGGGKDRTIEDEDYRCFGTGRYKLLSPTNSFAGGAAPAVSDRGDAFMQNGWLLFIRPVDRWINGTSATPTVKNSLFRTFDISLLKTENSTEWPATPIKIKLDVNPIWKFLADGTGTHPEAGSRTAYTISVSAAGQQLSIETPAIGNLRYGTDLPLIRFTITNNLGNLTTTSDPMFSLYAAESAVSSGPSPGRSIRAYTWFPVERMPTMNIKWQETTAGQRSSSVFIDGASIHERDIEWAVVTPEIGVDDGIVSRVRDIRGYLETGGAPDAASSDYMGLYNATVASDGKMLSGQKLDYTDPYVANRDALKKETVRNRMTNGKRIFNSVAKWSDGTGAGNDDYLVDNPEINEIDISTHARGESIIAAVFGRLTSPGSYLKLHKLTAVIQNYQSNRRKGR